MDWGKLLLLSGVASVDPATGQGSCQQCNQHQSKPTEKVEDLVSANFIRRRKGFSAFFGGFVFFTSTFFVRTKVKYVRNLNSGGMLFL
jgi:hypothetical protein